MTWRIDAGDARAVLGTWSAGSVQCVVTSPPYNLGASPSAFEHPHSARGLEWDWQGYAGGDRDDLPEPEYQAQQIAVLTDLYRVVAAGGSCWYVHKDRCWEGQLSSPLTWLLQTPWTLRQQIIWDRGSTHQHNGWYFDPVHEYVFWLTKGTPAHLGPARAWGSIWRIAPASNNPHPAPFPLELARRCVLAGSQPGETVLDPYCGSGTVGVACVALGREFIGIERQAVYVEQARQRIARETPYWVQAWQAPVTDLGPLFNRQEGAA